MTSARPPMITKQNAEGFVRFSDRGYLLPDFAGTNSKFLSPRSQFFGNSHQIRSSASFPSVGVAWV
jgi:hypothetical protein